MGRPRPPPGPGCISRRLARLLLLLLLLFHLLGVQPSPSSSFRAALLGPRPRPPPPSPTRNPLCSRLKADRLSDHATKAQLAERQPLVPTQNHPHLQDPHGHSLDPWQLSHDPLRQSWWMAAQRRKRHAAPRLYHAQLMRVGCALGTCQVQNLSHRLWQLKGQSGRHDASPMNPNSPHSYG